MILFFAVQPVPSNELGPAADYIRKYGFLDLDIEPEPFVPSSNAASITSANVSQPRAYNASGRNAKDSSRVRTFLRQGAERLVKDRIVFLRR